MKGKLEHLTMVCAYDPINYLLPHSVSKFNIKSMWHLSRQNPEADLILVSSTSQTKIWFWSLLPLEQRYNFGLLYLLNKDLILVSSTSWTKDISSRLVALIPEGCRAQTCIQTAPWTAYLWSWQWRPLKTNNWRLLSVLLHVLEETWQKQPNYHLNSYPESIPIQPYIQTYSNQSYSYQDIWVFAHMRFTLAHIHRHVPSCPPTSHPPMYAWTLHKTLFINTPVKSLPLWLTSPAQLGVCMMRMSSSWPADQTVPSSPQNASWLLAEPAHRLLLSLLCCPADALGMTQYMQQYTSKCIP